MVKEDIFAKIVLNSPNDKDEFCNHIINNLYLKYDNKHVTDKPNYEVIKILSNAICENIKNQNYLNEIYLFILKYRFFFFTFCYTKEFLMRYIFSHNDGIFHHFLGEKIMSGEDLSKDVLQKKLEDIYEIKSNINL